MQSFSRHTFSVLALLMYCVGGALIEIAHRDQANFFLQSHPVLERHDCGGVERHIAPEHYHSCSACSLSTSRVATAATSTLTLNVKRFCVATIVVHAEELLETDVLYSGKRGPPQA